MTTITSTRTLNDSQQQALILAVELPGLDGKGIGASTQNKLHYVRYDPDLVLGAVIAGRSAQVLEREGMLREVLVGRKPWRSVRWVPTAAGKKEAARIVGERRAAAAMVLGVLAQWITPADWGDPYVVGVCAAEALKRGADPDRVAALSNTILGNS